MGRSQEQDYPTQPQSEQPSYPPGQPVYVQAQPIIINPIPVWGTTPQQCTCPNCKGSIVTRVTYETGTGTWLIAGGICLVGLWCGCQFVPFCIDGAKDAHHHCPNCNQLIGSRALIR